MAPIYRNKIAWSECCGEIMRGDVARDAWNIKRLHSSKEKIGTSAFSLILDSWVSISKAEISLQRLTRSLYSFKIITSFSPVSPPWASTPSARKPNSPRWRSPSYPPQSSAWRPPLHPRQRPKTWLWHGEWPRRWGLQDRDQWSE